MFVQATQISTAWLRKLPSQNTIAKSWPSFKNFNKLRQQRLHHHTKHLLEYYCISKRKTKQHRSPLAGALSITMTKAFMLSRIYFSTVTDFYRDILLQASRPGLVSWLAWAKIVPACPVFLWGVLSECLILHPVPPQWGERQKLPANWWKL